MQDMEEGVFRVANWIGYDDKWIMEKLVVESHVWGWILGLL